MNMNSISYELSNKFQGISVGSVRFNFKTSSVNPSVRAKTKVSKSPISLKTESGSV